MTRTCLNWSEAFSGTDGSCEDPGHVFEAVRTPIFGPFPDGSSVTYTCNDGYKGGGQRTCQADGKWTEKPECFEIGKNLRLTLQRLFCRLSGLFAIQPPICFVLFRGLFHVKKPFQISLNSTFFAKSTQLAQFDKTSDACQCMKLVNLRGTANTESSAAHPVEHQTHILGRFCTHQCFVQGL